MVATPTYSDFGSCTQTLILVIHVGSFISVLNSHIFKLSVRNKQATYSTNFHCKRFISALTTRLTNILAITSVESIRAMLNCVHHYSAQRTTRIASDVRQLFGILPDYRVFLDADSIAGLAVHTTIRAGHMVCTTSRAMQ